MWTLNSRGRLHLHLQITFPTMNFHITQTDERKVTANLPGLLVQKGAGNYFFLQLQFPATPPGGAIAPGTLQTGVGLSSPDQSHNPSHAGGVFI